MGKKDIYWINAVKAISILAVFYVHSMLYYQYQGFFLDQISILVHPFYVNAFFFISGYLLLKKQLSSPLIDENALTYLMGGGRRLLNNILHRLIIPSTVFAIIEYLPSRLLRGIPVNIGDFLFKTVGGYTFWFTSALVVAELLFLILLLSRNKNVWFYSGLTILIGFVCIVLSQNNLMPSGLEFWAYKRGLMAVLFMGLGGLYWKYEKVVIENKLFKPYFMLPLLCVYVVIMLVFKANQGVISTFKITPMGVGTSVISIILLVALCRILPRNKALTFIGQNSIGFYFMSGSLPIILSMIFHHFLPGTHLIVMLLVFVLSVSISYAIVWLIVRYAPWIFDFRLIKKNGCN